VTVLFKVPRVSQHASNEVLKYTGFFQATLAAVYWSKPVPPAPAPRPTAQRSKAAQEHTAVAGAPRRPQQTLRYGVLCTAAGDEAARDCALAAWRPAEDTVVDVVGTQVTGALTRSAHALQSSLREAADAAPFIPLAQRLAFARLGRLKPPSAGCMHLAPYIRITPTHHICLFGIGAATFGPAGSCGCVVSPLIPAEMYALDREAAAVDSVTLGWEPDLSVPLQVQQVLQHLATAAPSPAAAGPQHLQVLLSQSAATACVRVSRPGASEQQVAAADPVHHLLQTTRSTVHSLGFSRSDTLVEQMQRLLAAEGMSMVQVCMSMLRVNCGCCMGACCLARHCLPSCCVRASCSRRALHCRPSCCLCAVASHGRAPRYGLWAHTCCSATQDSFNMDVVTGLHLAEYADLEARQTRVISTLPGAPVRNEVTRMPYRGPELSVLARETGMLACDSSTHKRYLLAIQVPNMLENRPVVVYGSRVHITYNVCDFFLFCYLPRPQRSVLISPGVKLQRVRVRLVVG
jgi:hypothetical protein